MYKELFHPKRIVICGLNKNRNKNFNKIYKNVRKNFKGEILTVEIGRKQITKKNQYLSVGQIVDEIDLALIILPASHLLPTLRECGAQDTKCAIVFSTTKSQKAISKKLKQKITAVGTQYGMHILGPRSSGFIDTDNNFNASILPTPKSGNMGLITQSTRRAEAIIKWSKKEDLGFSNIFSLGERACITENEMLLHLDEDPKTDLILICLESLADPKNFFRLVKMISPRKKIILIPTGTNAGSNFAKSTEYQNAAKEGALTTHSLPEFFTISKVMQQHLRKKSFLRYLGWK